MLDRQALMLQLAKSGLAGPMLYRREILGEQRVLPSVGGLKRIVRAIVL